MADENVLSTVVEEMRATNDVIVAAGDALDQKANFLFAGMSLIFGVVAAIVASQAPGTARPSLYWLLVAGFVLGYVAAIVVLVFVVLPRNYRTALLADRETIRREMIDRVREEALLALISGYVDTIAHNRWLNKTKSRGVKACAGLLVLMMLVLIAFGYLLL